MTVESMASQISQNKADLAAVIENCRQAHRRIDENDRITSGIHKLASNVEALALQVKLQGERMESHVSRMEKSLSSQGERIGQLEHEPGRKWKTLATQLTALAAAAMFGLLMAQLKLG